MGILALKRYIGEKIIFRVTEPCEFELFVAKIYPESKRGKVKVCIDAPRAVDIIREELVEVDNAE